MGEYYPNEIEFAIVRTKKILVEKVIPLTHT